jgi:hypothetical protein
MKKLNHSGVVAAALAAGALALIPMATAGPSPLATQGVGDPGRDPAGCPNVRAVEPVLFFDQFGATLGGPAQTSLRIYSDGTVLLDKIPSRSPALGGGGLSRAARANIAAVRHVDREPLGDPIDLLMAALLQLDVDGVCDDGQDYTDVPLSTVTAFADPATDSLAHTFSYWAVADGVHGMIEDEVQNFIAATFGL